MGVRKRGPTPPAVLRRWVEQYQAGVPVTVIAASAGLSRTTVSREIRRELKLRVLVGRKDWIVSG